MQALAYRLTRGDLQAWAKVYETHKRSVLGLCLGYLRHREDALDAAEETFVKAMKNAHLIQANGNLKGWLLTIAANTCRDWLRKRQRGNQFLRRWQAGRNWNHEPSPEAELAQEDKEAAVRRALARLPESSRLVLTLRFYAELEYEEIAEILSQTEGKPVLRGTVASRLNRAKGALKQLMEEDCR